MSNATCLIRPRLFSNGVTCLMRLTDFATLLFATFEERALQMLPAKVYRSQGLKVYKSTGLKVYRLKVYRSTGAKGLKVYGSPWHKNEHGHGNGCHSPQDP